MSTSAPTNKNIHIKKLREGIAGILYSTGSTDKHFGKFLNKHTSLSNWANELMWKKDWGSESVVAATSITCVWHSQGQIDLNNGCHLHYKI